MRIPLLVGYRDETAETQACRLGVSRLCAKAYGQILPDLSSEDIAMILAALNEAREEATDGGSADEKSAIFQKHKDRINTRLHAKGFDVVKATREWEARQKQSASQATP